MRTACLFARLPSRLPDGIPHFAVRPLRLNPRLASRLPQLVPRLPRRGVDLSRRIPNLVGGFARRLPNVVSRLAQIVPHLIPVVPGTTPNPAGQRDDKEKEDGWFHLGL